jgi:hypothetical protein
MEQEQNKPKMFSDSIDDDSIIKPGENILDDLQKDD